ncbi:hypothetical protein EN979_16700, partial [Mesorhizobium sp. M7A.F.Ca.US.001.04.2.1]
MVQYGGHRSPACHRRQSRSIARLLGTPQRSLGTSIRGSSGKRCRGGLPGCRGCLLGLRFGKAAYHLFGLYPYGEEWRGLLAMMLFVVLAVTSTMRRLWGRTLIAAWLVVIPIGTTLMYGALPLGFVTIPIPGLSIVETRLWGGLPLTIGLSTIALATAFPISILLALGRCSNMPMIRAACITYIELVRGVPLITVLFLASVLFPLFLPEGWNFDYLLRAQIA